MSETAEVLCSLLPLHSIAVFKGLEITGPVQPDNDCILLPARSTCPTPACPDCGIESARVHSRYWRQIADLPCFGRRVVLKIHVRRLRCTNASCRRRTFGERLPEVARPLARRSDRLRTLHGGIALALGGAPGARLSRQLSLPASGSTLLRAIRDVTAEPPPEPQVLGVDDWAWRKGTRYGTILCDLERGRTIDLLPDRTAETFAAWLRRHPSVAIVARDRAGAYADGARQGAPQAIQVADRWHLLRNGTQALQQVLEQHHRDLRDAAQAAASPAIAAEPPLAPGAAADTPDSPPLTRAQRRSLDRRHRREARFEAAVRLREQGLSIRALARELGIERKTARRWLRAGHAPTWRHANPSRSILDPFREYLETRWAEGCRNAAELWREIRERGFTGQRTVVKQWAAGRRPLDPPGAPDRQGSPAAGPIPSQAPQPPTPRRAARLLMIDHDRLAEDDRRFVEALLSRSPPVARAVELTRAFSTMIKGRLADKLDDWIKAAREGGLAGFADSLSRDREAVHAALTLPWSTGPVEGHINRLKVIKRDMYGRAGFGLLRSRVLAAA